MVTKSFDKRPTGRPTKRPDIEALARLYQCFDARAIANILQVKESTVRSWIARARKNNHDEWAAAEAKYPQWKVKRMP